MEDYVFDRFLRDFRTVPESTSYLEILKYADSTKDICKEHALLPDEFDDFIQRSGAFAPNTSAGTERLSGLRIVLQQNASHPDTFKPMTISLPSESYRRMFNAFHLPKSVVETTSAVGPIFWSSLDLNDGDPYLYLVHRKADVRKQGKTRGWEMILSYSFKSRIVSGYVKGTPTSHVSQAITQLKACVSDVSHPMLLPLIFFSDDVSSINDQKQRDARDWLRRLENELSRKKDMNHHSDPDKYLVDIDALSKDLVECHATVLTKNSQAYKAILEEIQIAMNSFWNRWLAIDQGALSIAVKSERKLVEKLHKHMQSKLHLYKVKLKGLEAYKETTLERLRIQREMLSNIMSQRDTRFSIEIAGEQRRIAYAAKKDSVAMKTLSFIGVLFLPGTFIATMFGMSFFNFESEASPVSEQVWIYFAITIPTTVILLFYWAWYEARQRREDMHLEQSIERIEKDIMANIRRRGAQQASPATYRGSFA